MKLSERQSRWEMGSPTYLWFVSLTARMLPCHGSGAGSIPAQTANLPRQLIIGKGLLVVMNANNQSYHH